MLLLLLLLLLLLFYFFCVCLSFLVRFFLGCLSFPDLKGAAFSRFGVTWVPEVFSHVRRGVFHVDHFLRLNRNWKPRMKRLWHSDVDLGGGGGGGGVF